jgi:hypothetical protein
MLSAAVLLVMNCMRMIMMSPDHYPVLAKGLQRTSSNDAVEAQDEGRDDVLAALDATLLLTTSLVTEGPWWKEARAHHPILLIDALASIVLVRQGIAE